MKLFASLICAQPVPKALSCVPMVASGKAERFYFFNFCGSKIICG